MSVLIITERNDIHGHALIWALESLGVRCDRWSMSKVTADTYTQAVTPVKRDAQAKSQN
jgi:hypothetical protein